MALTETIVVAEGTGSVGPLARRAHLVNEDGTAFTGGSSFSGSYNDLTDKPTIPAAYTLPAATTSALGGVKKAAAVAKAADGGDAAAAITAVNALIDALKASGALA